MRRDLGYYIGEVSMGLVCGHQPFYVAVNLVTSHLVKEVARAALALHRVFEVAVNQPPSLFSNVDL